jgi:hypothetical protein
VGVTRAGLAGRLLLAGGALVGALAALELLAPHLVRQRCGGGAAPFWRPSRSVGWALVPNARGESIVCEGQVETVRRTVAINAHGQRDRPRTWARTGRPRVLVLGDSFVEALQVDLEDTFVAQLEDRLDIEALNAGVSGYSTDNELRAFETTGRRYAPDAVLVVLHVGNDVLENGARLYLKSDRGLPPKAWLRARDADTLLAGCLAAHRLAGHAAATTPSWLWAHSRVVRFVLVRGTSAALAAACGAALGPSVLAGVPELLGVYGAPPTPAWAEGWETTEELLAELAGRVRDTGAAFGVALGPAGFEYDPRLRVHEALYPATRAVTWDFDYPYRRFAEMLDRHQIAWTSLRAPLEEHHRATGQSGCYAWDGHWTAEGHRVVAAALEPFVRRLLAM